MRRHVPLNAKSELKRSGPIQRKAKDKPKVMRAAPKNAKPKSEAVRLRNKVTRLAAKCVRYGSSCIAAGESGYQCSSRIECCHVISRSEWCIRVHPANMVPMCNIHHRRFTVDEEAWQEFVETLYPGRRELLKSYVRGHVASKQKIDWLHWLAYWEAVWKEIEESEAA